MVVFVDERGGRFRAGIVYQGEGPDAARDRPRGGRRRWRGYRQRRRRRTRLAALGADTGSIPGRFQKPRENPPTHPPYET